MLLLCIHLVDVMLTFPSSMMLCLILWHGIAKYVNYLDSLRLRLCVKVASQWRFVILIKSLESFRLMYGSSPDCIAERGVCLARVLLISRLIYRLFSAKWKLITNVCCGIQFDRTLTWRSGCIPSFSLALLSFHVFYLVACHGNCWYDCAFQCRLCTHQRLLALGWNKVETFAIL